MLTLLDRQAASKTSNSTFNCDYFSDDDFCVEMKIWRAVIMQALQDAKSVSQKPAMIKAHNAALLWLYEDDNDFFEVCELAGFEPKNVRAKALAARERGFAWRKESARLM